MSLVIVDSGGANLASVRIALQRLGVDAPLTCDPATIAAAGRVLLPGVGAAAPVMQRLRESGLIDVLRALRQPLLGICVGMQVLFEHGIEHGVETKGLGEWPGTVERLEARRLPHMGWNTVDPAPGSRLFDGLAGERFYFVHSYAARRWEAAPSQRPPPLVSWAEHDGDRFVAAVEHGPLSATQFHPEKSGNAGAGLLERWVRGVAA